MFRVIFVIIIKRMEYKIDDNKIKLIFPAKNNGKFRFKTRKKSTDFGDSFSTRKLNFNDNVYLEWQIGYDATVLDVSQENKETKLDKISFVGSNGKKKYPYELSELVYESVKLGLNKISLEDLLKEVEDYNELITSRKINVEKDIEVKVNNLPFQETITKLPTFFMVDTGDGTQIEISIQKQQYAAGVQPMIYFVIPFTSFSNYKELEGGSSNKGDVLVYEIDKSNSDVLFNMMRVFGMSSENHKKDIEEIIKVLIKLLKD